ncbi:hypothetical protein BCR43DRAFT_467124 [Syncephalastrum racemosum]|uniref:Pentacotripeptide-repeat region of PRORP domain-containing protein n=1 Tax=Syncephalastrum racemosum TaxID=13706 RepID=A0A1X2HWP0_SYNRA|nr:hypothetical protein BCR43DRAFT_467124 [Syncephalastrum racemosum]
MPWTHPNHSSNRQKHTSSALLDNAVRGNNKRLASGPVSPLQNSSTVFKGPLASLNLGDHVALSDLDRAIADRKAESAFSVFTTLTHKNAYIPLQLCSALYSLLAFAKYIGGRGKVASFRGRQIQQLFNYVETEFELPRAQFVANAEVIPIESYKLLQKFIRNRRTASAWSVYLQMTDEERKRVSRNTYLQLMVNIFKSPSLSQTERENHLAFIAAQHASIPDNDRCLTANEIQLAGELVWRAVNYHDTSGARRLLEVVRLDEKYDQTLYEVSFVNIMAALHSHRKNRAALELFSNLIASGRPPSIRVFNRALSIFADIRAAQEADTTFDTILRLGIKPDEATFAELIRVHKNKGNVHAAVDYYYRLADYDHIRPNAYIFSALIELYAVRRDLPNVLRWFQTMLLKGVQPNEVIVSCVMKAFQTSRRRKEDLEDILTHIMAHAQAAGLKADALLFNLHLVISGAARGLKGAFDVHHEMLSRLVKPNVYTYTTLIDICGKNGEYETAERIFGLMKESQDSKPNTVTYCAMMMVWARSGDKDKLHQIAQEFEQERVLDVTGRLWEDPHIIERIQTMLEASPHSLPSE